MPAGRAAASHNATPASEAHAASHSRRSRDALDASAAAGPIPALPGAEAGAGWRVGVRNPLRPDRRLGHLLLQDRALATSGSGTQFFIHAGRRFGHILDPRTGWPAEGVLSVSALAPSAAAADALATAFYVLGADQAQAYCERHADVGFVMILPGPHTGSLEIRTAGLCDGEWTPAADN